MRKPLFTGSGVAVITPFTSETVDYAAMTDDELYQAISRTLTELATSRERSVAVHG